MKQYTEEDLRKIVSKKYHNMINWEATMFCGFHNCFVLNDFGQWRHSIWQADYGAIRNINWFLREISKNPQFDF